MSESPKVSIIIPTLDRASSLGDCLKSISDGTYKNYEIIKVTEEGELPALRNKGAKKATGEILTFIDDDVVCSEKWLESIVKTFASRNVVGVSGPAVIRSDYRSNRDIFRFHWIYRLLFLDGREDLPGHITKAGAWTTGACNEWCGYDGPVDFLEACNFSVKRDSFWRVGGYDESFRGIGDWSEPDLCFRLKRAGYKLWFCRDAALDHRPSRSGAYKKRRSKCFRMENYELFSSRWVDSSLRHSFYKQFMRTYYWMKEHGWLG